MSRQRLKKLLWHILQFTRWRGGGEAEANSKEEQGCGQEVTARVRWWGGVEGACGDKHHLSFFYL